MSKPVSPRMRKVNSIIHHVVAQAVENLKDPRLELVTITGVDTSPDLRRATIFISTLDAAAGPEAVSVLEHAAHRLRRSVGAEIRTKYTPELSFAIDPGVVGGEQIDNLLRQLREGGPSE